MKHNDDDVKTWIAEWRLWAGVSVILVIAWVMWSLLRGSFDMYWPLGIVVVWAAILLLAPLWPSKPRRSTGSSPHAEDDRNG